PEGEVWVATFGGIAHFNDGHFTAITPQQGLPAEVCYSITRDKHGVFWIGTNQGILRFNYQAYQKAGNEAEYQSFFKLITQHQGLITNEMNTGAAFVDDAANVWFGSVGGLI